MKVFCTVIMILAIVAVPVVLGVAVGSCASSNRKSETANIHEQGVRAYRSGVRAEANPYQGAGQDGGRRATLWLDGWMDAKESDTNSKEKR